MCGSVVWSWVTDIAVEAGDHVRLLSETALGEQWALWHRLSIADARSLNTVCAARDKESHASSRAEIKEKDARRQANQTDKRVA